MFGRHQPDIVAASGEYPSEMMGAAAGLHPDDARTKLLRQPDQSLAPHLAPHHNRPRRIQPDDAANILAKVDPKHRDIHPFLLLISRRAYDAGRRGGPFHKFRRRCLRSASRRKPKARRSRSGSKAKRA